MSLQDSAAHQAGGSSSRKNSRYLFVIDTNILVRAFYSNGNARAVFTHILKNHTLIVSDYIIDEFINFAKHTMPKTSRKDIALMRRLLETFAEEYADDYDVVVRDINDVPILQLAIEHSAAVLTGDKDLLEHRHGAVPPVLSLEEYAQLFLPIAPRHQKPVK